MSQRLQPHEPLTDGLLVEGVGSAPPGPLAQQDALASGEATAAALASATAAATAAASSAAVTGKGQQQQLAAGPRLEFSASRLVVNGVAGDSGSGAHATLTVVSTGTAVVRFWWAPLAAAAAAEAGWEEEKTDDDLAAGRPAADALGPGVGWLFHQPARCGAILPGETRTFVFSFRSAEAGVFDETWAMTTEPPLLPPAPAPQQRSQRVRSGEPFLLSLRGIAVPADAGREEVARAALEAGLRGRERDQAVRVLNLFFERGHRGAEPRLSVGRERQNAKERAAAAAGG